MLKPKPEIQEGMDQKTERKCRVTVVSSAVEKAFMKERHKPGNPFSS